MPPHLHMAGESLDNLRHRIGIDGMPGKCAIEIDNMDMVRARIGKEHRLCRRIIAVNRCTVHIALGKANNLPAFQVDGGEND